MEAISVQLFICMQCFGSRTELRCYVQHVIHIAWVAKSGIIWCSAFCMQGADWRFIAWVV